MSAMPPTLVPQEQVEARWLRPEGYAFRYARPGNSESPRMQGRIGRLYQDVHQRTVPRSKTIGLAFARGLLAEKLGYSVNWSEFAFKVCTRGKKKDIPFRRYKRPRVPETEDDEGADSDWEVNLKVPLRAEESLPTYDRRQHIHPKPPSTIKPPSWRGNNRPEGELLCLIYSRLL